MLKEIIANSLEDLPKAAEELLLLAGDEARVFLFNAPMGTGKTTFIKVLCGVLGVQENVSSPTFSIVNEYSGAKGPIYHFDFYRLKEEQEAFDLGYEEYFYSGNYCFVEWPQKIENLLPEEAVFIEIATRSDNSRVFRLIE